MNNPKLHVMLDLETLGLTPGCGILSIGAVTLDLESTFYERVEIKSNAENGLISDDETLTWWDKQSTEARLEAFCGMTSLPSVLNSFAHWFGKLPSRSAEDILVWGNGADFDVPILKVAYKKLGIPFPIATFNARCYRTLKGLYPEVAAPARLKGATKHNALDDAIHQAKHLKKLLAF